MSFDLSHRESAPHPGYRGSKTTSVLANLHSDRFLGFGFLAVGYFAPSDKYGLEYLRESSIKYLGRETFGYW